jgi:hypothetical protein
MRVTEAKTVDAVALKEWRDVSEIYCAWFNAEQESGAALNSWYAASPAARPAGYAAYRAALDREEAAAKELHRLWRKARR